MSDYIGSITLGNSGTYRLQKFTPLTAEDGSVSLALGVLVVSTSSDALGTAVGALVAQLSRGNTYAHYQPAATYPTTYNILSCSNIEYTALAGDPETAWQAFRQYMTFTLTAEKQAEGALTSLYSASGANLPTSVSLSTLLGTQSTQLDVKIDDDNSTDMHSVWAALAPSALSEAKWLVLSSALTWTTMSSGTGGTYWGNVRRYTTSAAFQTAQLDTSLYPAGTYRLLARVMQTAGTGYIMDSQNNTAVAITRMSPNLQVIGDVTLPVQDSAYGVASNLTLSARSDGTNTLNVNAFVLLPLDLGYFSWHPDTVSAEIDALDVGPTGVFMDGLTDFTSFQGGILEPKVLAAHTATLISPASPTGSTFPSNWDQTDAQCSADGGYYKCVAVAGSSWMWCGNSINEVPVVTPGEWYEVSCNLNVTAYTDGDVELRIEWLDIDGNVIRNDLLDAADGAPAVTAPLCYVKAPVHATRALVIIGAGASATFTAYWDSVVFRRCPLNLIMIAEDGDGVVDGSFVHPVHVTVQYRASYGISR